MVAGTLEGTAVKMPTGAAAASSRKLRSPSAPATFTTSCGSAITHVVPCGSTASPKAAGSTMLDSMCTCASTKPAVTTSPVQSSVSAPAAGRPSPTAAIQGRPDEYVGTETVPADRPPRNRPSSILLSCRSLLKLMFPVQKWDFSRICRISGRILILRCSRFPKRAITGSGRRCR